MDYRKFPGYHWARRLKKRVNNERNSVWLRTAGVHTGQATVLRGKPHLRLATNSTITLGDRVVLTGNWRHNDLDAPNPCTLRTTRPNATILIGDDSGLTSATVSAAFHIEIGKRVLIGSGVIITDSNHHFVDIASVRDRRYAGPPQVKATDRIIIEDDVFVGARTIILRGTTIGQGTVIGAGSVVSGNLDPFSVYGGNPAKLLRVLRNR